MIDPQDLRLQYRHLRNNHRRMPPGGLDYLMGAATATAARQPCNRQYLRRRRGGVQREI
jgi:hypothetical protein